MWTFFSLIFPQRNKSPCSLGNYNPTEEKENQTVVLRFTNRNPVYKRREAVLWAIFHATFWNAETTQDIDNYDHIEYGAHKRCRLLRKLY